MPVVSDIADAAYQKHMERFTRENNAETERRIAAGAKEIQQRADALISRRTIQIMAAAQADNRVRQAVTARDKAAAEREANREARATLRAQAPRLCA